MKLGQILFYFSLTKIRSALIKRYLLDYHHDPRNIFVVNIEGICFTTSL